MCKIIHEAHEVALEQINSIKTMIQLISSHKPFFTLHMKAVFKYLVILSICDWDVTIQQ